MYQSLFSKPLAGMSGNVIREILKLTQQPDFISFAGGMPSTDLLPIEAIQGIANEAFKKYGTEILQYGTSEGFLPLREYIVELMAGKGINTTVSEVVITNGSQQGIDLVGKTFLNPGDRVMVEDPTYLAAIQIFTLYQAAFTLVKSDQDGLMPSSVQSLARKDKHKLAYLVPNFQNPTGISLSPERRKELAQLVDEFSLVLIEDDPYGELRYDGEAIPPVKAYDKGNRVIYLGSFSKTVSPGLRVGFAVGHPDIIKKMVVGKQTSDVHTSILSQAIICEFCQQGMLGPHIRSLQQVYRKKRDLMLELLKQHFPPEILWKKPAGGLFIWLELPAGISSADLLQETLKEKIAFIPGNSFYALGGGTNTLRLNFSNADPAQMEDGIRRLGKITDKYLTKYKLQSAAASGIPQSASNWK